MSKYEWDTTAADNDNADGNINWLEGQAPSSVNGSARAMMAAEASFTEAIGGAKTTGGTGAAYTLTLADAPTAYTTSMLFLVKFNTESTSTTATINVNSLGAKTLKTWDGSALPSTTYIPADAYGFLKYDGTDMRVFLPGLALDAGLTDIAGLAVTDGNIIVGDGANWVAESGATARTSLGLGTGNSPQFTAVNIGHATDTTVTRAGAGDLNIEGNVVYRAGGTDVPAADGGTGRSSHTAYAVLCGGTTSTAAQQSIAGVGTSGQVLTSNGAAALPTFEDADIADFTRETEQATTSGTEVDFTGIPAGVSEIVISFAGVSLDGTGNVLVQLGDSGGVETSGYVSASRLGNTTSTAGFIVSVADDADALDGVMTLYRQDGNKWRALHALSKGVLTTSGGGAKTLSAELTQLRVTLTADNFDAGAVNIMYR